MNNKPSCLSVAFALLGWFVSSFLAGWLSSYILPGYYGSILGSIVGLAVLVQGYRRASDKDNSRLKTGMIVLITLYLSGFVFSVIAVLLFMGYAQMLHPSSPTTATDIPLPIAILSSPTAVPHPTIAATPDPCFRWDQVTATMKGRKICVRGRISNLVQTRKVGTRYEFSDKSNTFFLFSALWEVTDPRTGKTLGPGICIEATDKIQLQSGVPFIDIDQSLKNGVFNDLRFYDAISPCP